MSEEIKEEEAEECKCSFGDCRCFGVGLISGMLGFAFGTFFFLVVNPYADTVERLQKTFWEQRIEILELKEKLEFVPPTEEQFMVSEHLLQQWYDDHGFEHFKAVPSDFLTDGKGNWKLGDRLWFGGRNGYGPADPQPERN